MVQNSQKQHGSSLKESNEWVGVFGHKLTGTSKMSSCQFPVESDQKIHFYEGLCNQIVKQQYMSNKRSICLCSWACSWLMALPKRFRSTNPSWGYCLNILGNWTHRSKQIREMVIPVRGPSTVATLRWERLNHEVLCCGEIIIHGRASYKLDFIIAAYKAWLEMDFKTMWVAAGSLEQYYIKGIVILELQKKLWPHSKHEACSIRGQETHWGE